MNKSELPLIGIGPGSLPIKTYKGKRSGIGWFVFRVLNKLYYFPSAKRRYVSAVSNALKVGYRLIDYSSAYGCDAYLGRGIEKSGVDRADLFITTRVSNRAQREHRVREEFMEFLHNAHLDYVDLLQFHWPVTDLYLDTWREMEKLKDEGLVKHLGVANCHQHHLEEIFKICKHRPEIGQFEIHPLFTQKPLIQYYKDNGIVVESYTAVARYDGRLFNLPVLKEMARKHNKSLVQIVLRWHVQHELIPVVRSLSYRHQQENLNIFDFELSTEEMAVIDGLNINSRLRYDPDNCDFSIL
ncbi:MAG: aldo/keto reductase [Bacteroidaceae bacterium]|nr:aldo/keto reductase [Bacteroidaceae bacterium]